MQLTERLVELASEVARRNGDISKGREAFDVEVQPWAIVIRLRAEPVVLIDPDPQPFPVAPGRPLNYVQGNPWYPDSDPWGRHD